MSKPLKLTAILAPSALAICSLPIACVAKPKCNQSTLDSCNMCWFKISFLSILLKDTFCFLSKKINFNSGDNLVNKSLKDFKKATKIKNDLN